jgi:hypothetical protein
MILVLLTPFGFSQTAFQPQIPRTWDEKALAEWATPISGINLRPNHISERAYYAMPVDNLRTYPVYTPDKEPPGYWELLQKVGPKPLISPGELTTEADWIEAGRVIFEEGDHIHLRTQEPRFIEAVRAGFGILAGKDGVAANYRWVPTKSGVALSFPNCSACHMGRGPNGLRIAGAPTFTGSPRPNTPRPLITQVHLAKHYVIAAAPIQMGSEALGLWQYSAFGVPWRQDDINLKLKSLSLEEHETLINAGLRGGAIPRWNGSLYYPAKVPDLIGIKERRYIDATGTHLNRGIGDVMRYAAAVSFAEPTKFGSYDVLGPNDALPTARRSDEALYALALYIESLKPPANPNPIDESSKAGETIFRREGCPGCHTPPLYTNNKLTLAAGFTLPKNAPSTLDVLPISVGTDSGLALKTRKGTGYYKVPSLKGVWYRGHYLHDGAAASLEEMFDPDRLNATHKAGGYLPPGSRMRAIAGHEFGLRLTKEERRQLIAFLRTL